MLCWDPQGQSNGPWFACVLLWGPMAACFYTDVSNEPAL